MSENTQRLKNSPVESLSPHGKSVVAAQSVVDNYAHLVDETDTLNMWVRGSQEVLELAKKGSYFETPLEAVRKKEAGMLK